MHATRRAAPRSPAFLPINALNFTVCPITILVAEDHANFREFACNELRRRPDFRVVAVSDGQDAVEKAVELRPELIVLDIGLPALDGLTAARRIRTRCPESSIVFLTRESSPDIVHAAFKLGSRGFIDKMRARYLLPTVEAILEHDRAPHRHHAQFSADDETMLQAIERFLASALSGYDGAIAIATRAHQKQLLERLTYLGATLDRAIENGSFVLLDADELVSGVLTDGLVRWGPLLIQTVETAARATARPDARVAVFGESASILLAAGHVDAANELEQLGSEVVRTMPVDIMCAYSLRPLSHASGFKTACTHHRTLAIQ
jgi:DNA-binding NarL/FixJ family response regulator